MPSASAASLPGSAGSRSRRFTISCTCALAAWPWPATACFICSAVYSATGRSRGDQRRERGAARLAQQQRALRIDVDEHDLHRRACGLVALDHLADAVEEHLQPRRQVAARQVAVLMVPLAT